MQDEKANNNSTAGLDLTCVPSTSIHHQLSAMARCGGTVRYDIRVKDRPDRNSNYLMTSQRRSSQFLDTSINTMTTFNDIILYVLFTVSFCNLVVALCVFLVTVQVTQTMVRIRGLAATMEAHFAVANNDDGTAATIKQAPSFANDNDQNESTIPLYPTYAIMKRESEVFGEDENLV